MMYRVVHEKTSKDLAVIGVSPSVLQLPHVMVTDGNAANNPTHFFKASDGLKIIEGLWPVIQAEYWNDLDGSKRKIMAECLVPDRIPAETRSYSLLADHETKKRVEGLIGAGTVPVVPEPISSSSRILPLESVQTFHLLKAICSFRGCKH